MKSIDCSRPVAPATWKAGSRSTPSGNPRISATTAAETATRITTICLTSAQVTAWTPPNIVYAVVGIPIARTVSGRLHPEDDRQDHGRRGDDDPGAEPSR